MDDNRVSRQSRTFSGGAGLNSCDFRRWSDGAASDAKMGIASTRWLGRRRIGLISGALAAPTFAWSRLEIWEFADQQTPDSRHVSRPHLVAPHTPVGPNRDGRIRGQIGVLSSNNERRPVSEPPFRLPMNLRTTLRSSPLPELLRPQDLPKARRCKCPGCLLNNPLNRR